MLAQTDGREIRINMKICYIGWANSIHTRRWVEWFALRGHRVSLITHLPSPVEVKNTEVYEIGPEPDNLKEKIEFIKNTIDKVKPDILHLHTAFYPAYLGLFANFSPMVITFWNGDVSWSFFSIVEPYHNLVVRAILKRADLVTVNSVAAKDACFRYGLPRDKLVEIQWGADIERFRPDIEIRELKEELNLGDSPVVLSTRSFGAISNIDTIIRSIPLVAKKFPDVKFVFTKHAQDEGYRVKLDELIKELRVEKNIIITPFLKDYNTLAKYYALADVFISLSDKDSTPSGMLEAMACGAVPVMGDIPPIRDWIKDDYNGYLVNTRNPVALSKAIIDLLRDKEKRRLFIERNLEIVKEKADHQKNMERMEGLYFSLLEDRSPRIFSAYPNHFYKGLEYLLIESPKMAIEELKEALRSNQTAADIHYLLSMALSKEGKIEEAIVECKRAIEVDGSCAEYFVQLGILCDKIDRQDEAIENFKISLEINSQSAASYCWLRVYWRLGLIDEELLAEHAKGISITPLEGYYICAILFGKGFVDEGLEELKELIKNFSLNPVVAYTELGKVLLKDGLLSLAIEVFRRVIKLDPNYPPAHYHLGSCFEKEGMFTEARNEFKRVISLIDDPQKVKNLFSGACYHLGIIYKKEGLTEEAIAMLKKCLEVDHQHKMANYWIAELKDRKD